MTIKTKITFKEYRNLLFGLTYQRPLMKLIVAAGCAMILWIVGYYIGIPIQQPLIYQYITLALIAVVQPTVVYLTIKRNFDSSNHLGEELDITVTPEQINVRGESFYMEIAWEKIFKVKEVKNWFLIYQNNLSAILISKDDISAEQMAELRKILKAVPNLPLHLKEDKS